MSTDPNAATELEAPDPTLSSDAADSTYAAATDVPETNPPSGPAVEQTLGKPGGGSAAAAGGHSSKRSSSSSASS